MSAELVDKWVAVYTATAASTRDIGMDYGLDYRIVARELRLRGVELAPGKKISKKLSGRPGSRKGAKHTEEARKKMSASLAGRSSPTKGKIYTATERRNISEGVKRTFAVKPTAKVAAARAVGVEVISKARGKCKNLLHRVLKVTGRKKAARTYELLGYTERELIAHLESKFKPGMSWDVRESFHIDHIKPVSAFIREGEFDPKVINALSNLQPLYPWENRAKSDTYTEGVA